ncbi:hypothetical protein BH09BAC2_BH09BAC2_19930 [soil metagenome]
MIKKLDKLILKTFLWPFLGTFFITLFVLLMQIIWKYIDDLVGKGLDFFTIIKFVIYASATMVTLALPIAILLSSIMTFGKLGETYELVAIKSSGISLLRFMRPLFFVSILLCGITFLFANYIIPVATLKFEVLYADIYRKSPAFDLKDGVFYNGLRGFSIKVGKKGSDKSTLNNVIIYERSYGPQDNSIISEKGYMKLTPDKKFLEFKLLNGNRYEEKGDVSGTNNELIKLSFKEYNKLFDLHELDMQSTSDTLFRKGYRMLNMRQLDVAIDSMQKIPDSIIRISSQQVNSALNYNKYKDKIINTSVKSGNKIKQFDDLVPDSLKSVVNERFRYTISMLQGNVSVAASGYDNESRELRRYLIEWHRKFALSLACLVLFFIGAPLGAIIRKGGMGVPLLFSILFFVIFHLLNTFGEKFVKEDVVTPLTGMWLSVFVLTPVGIFLTYKASIDSQLFNKEFYTRVADKISPFFAPLLNRFKKQKHISTI